MAITEDWLSGSPIHPSTEPRQTCGLNVIILSVSKAVELSEAVRATIRLMGNPYASLTLREPSDEEAMIIPGRPQGHALRSVEKNPESQPCNQSDSPAAPPSPSRTI
jgi:hypothetical protein